MAGKVLNIDKLMEPDHLGCAISKHFITWDALRQPKVAEWKEVQQYIYATDTSKTSNSRLPWSNKTTIPKLCQIRDNLFSNYMATLFPKRKWLIWEGDDRDSEYSNKKPAIESYMGWAVDRNEWYDEIAKVVLDYIDYGNCFIMPEWFDRSVQSPDGRRKYGFVGPSVRRISPLDIVFNPTAPNFAESPKIIRSIVSMGEVKKILEQESKSEEDLAAATELYNYLKELRSTVGTHKGAATVKDDIYTISGFGDFQQYLGSGSVEILTFYGDIYDSNTDELRRNQIIKVVDRHKIIAEMDNPSFFGTMPIYHAAWRVRPDNLWGMGPLDNLVGMQYRIDHLENMKADVFDLIAYPPIKIKGYVEDFEWAPMERIYTGDDGEVEMMAPAVQALAADNQIAILEAKMEEMAGSPKEAMGFRTPGEKTAYEVQRLENAASRVFQNKTAQFERTIVEPALNSMLELARRNMTRTTIRSFNSDLKIAAFMDLTPEDITGMGRIKPIAARHFAEQSQMVQNLNAFYASPAFQHVAAHFSSAKAASLWENLLEIEDFNIVSPYVAISEQADAQRFAQSAQEQVMMEQQTASGIGIGNHDPEAEQGGDPYPLNSIGGSGQALQGETDLSLSGPQKRA